VEQQLALPESMTRVRLSQFPLFLTVQRFVYMLDASFQNSFFSRRSDGRIIGMEQSSLGWHSEDRGVFMINQDFKQSDELKKQIQEFELAVLSGEKDDKLDEFKDLHIEVLGDVGQTTD